MTGILTITINPAIDVNTTVDNVDVERKLRCSTPTHEPGGGGLNVSRAIHKLGGDSTAFYTSGGVTEICFRICWTRRALITDRYLSGV